MTAGIRYRLVEPNDVMFTHGVVITPPQGGGGGGAPGVAPAKETWQPAEIASDQVGTQVGPNGQYSLHPTPIASLISQTAAGFSAGDITISTANKVVTGVTFTGAVTTTASGITFNSCRLKGNQSTPKSLLTNMGATPVVLNDCWFDPTLPLCDSAVIGGYYTAWRCEIWRTVDGFGPRNVTGSALCNAYHYNCYVHDLCAGLTQHSGTPSHNDGVQHQGGNNMEIIGCTIRGFVDHTFGDGPGWNAGTATSESGQRQFGPNYQCNSCVQLNENNGKGITSGVKISHNDFDGGCFCLNLATNSLGQNITIDEMVGNRFGHNQGKWANDGHGNSGFTRNDGGNNTWIFNPNSSVVTVTSYSDNLYKDNSIAVNNEGY